MAIAHRPWAGQVAAALASVGVGVSLAAPAAVSVKEVAADGEDAFLAQLSDARGSKVKEYVAVTGAGTDNLSLPAYLAAIPQRSRRRALTQLRCGSHWLAEETGRWLRLQRSDRLCPHCLTEGAYHVEDVAHAILHCPRAAALRGQFAELFTGRSASSLAALFAVTDSHQLAAFSRALRSLHD